jgi:hypothetical protein
LLLAGALNDVPRFPEGGGKIQNQEPYDRQDGHQAASDEERFTDWKHQIQECQKAALSAMSCALRAEEFPGGAYPDEN